jgi:hypothetical protein
VTVNAIEPVAGTPARAPDDGVRPDPAPLDWSWNPWRERPRRAACAFGCTLGAWAVARVAGASAAPAIVLALALAGSLAPLLVPQRCRLDHFGAHLRGAFGWERRPWADVRRVARRAGGILLSPYPAPRRLDAWRALFLPLPAARSAALEPLLREHLGHHGL